MADYPSLDISDQSQVVSRGGLVTDEAEDGTIRTRDIYAAVNYDITLVHPNVTSTDKTTLESHYAANKGSTFNLTSMWGDSYTVRYLDAPKIQPLKGGYFHLTARLTGVKV